MKRIKELFGRPVYITAMVFLCLFYIALISASFWLMNYPDTLAFCGGVLMFFFVLSIAINSIYIKIKNN